MAESNIIIYQTEDGKTKIETRLEDETVWLTIDQMAELFQKSRSTINEHILHIYEEQELDKQLSMRKIGISDFSTKPTNYYNLDIIISVGYRVKSHQEALKKANAEYEQYKEQTNNELSEAEKHFVKQIESTAKKLTQKKPKK